MLRGRAPTTAAFKALVICFLGSGKSSDLRGEMRHCSSQEAHHDSTRVKMPPVAGYTWDKEEEAVRAAGQYIQAERSNFPRYEAASSTSEDTREAEELFFRLVKISKASRGASGAGPCNPGIVGSWRLRGAYGPLVLPWATEAW